MSKYSKDDILRMVREEHVEFIRMQFTDTWRSRPRKSSGR